MSEASPAFLHAPSHYELVFVGSRGAMTRCFGFQPTTEDIAYFRAGQRYCVQLIGESYEVYDLDTISKPKFLPVTIGLPVFVHEDPDAAIMWALMNV